MAPIYSTTSQYGLSRISVLSVSKSWPEFPAPYLTSVHASAVTCLAHITDIEPGMLETLTQV